MTIKSILTLNCLAVLSMAGCATSDNACKDVTLASEQVQQCQSLQRQIAQAKDRPIIRTELERRYEQDCIEVRYYRDDKQEAICGSEDRKKEAVESFKKDNQ
ncbi:hypothetical protein HII17_09950 [Thalassotalea sp. M1531]|uniref:Lipoprotein n=2 Tax=Thalassotalea algicola TaxID=2716224 RepID=A0A7Y0LC88_9GAMM|nr:hypothetical protein [Thalassotalea algicola]